VRHRTSGERGVVLRVEPVDAYGDRVLVAIEQRSTGNATVMDHVRAIGAGELELDGDDLGAAVHEAMSVDSIFDLAHLSRGARCLDELAARLEFEAVRVLRASDGFAERKRFDLAAGERERAALLQRRAAAVRALERARARRVR
jgi:hypothetical protein